MAHWRHTQVSSEIRNFDIGVFVGTSMQRIEPQGDVFVDHSHLHYSFGFSKWSTNRTTGISFLLRKSKCSQQKVISLESPSPKEDICGRLALMRYRNGMEDFAVLGCYFPPKPTSNGKKEILDCLSLNAWVDWKTHFTAARALHTFSIWRRQWRFWNAPSGQHGRIILSNWRSQNWQRKICWCQGPSFVWASSLRPCINFFFTQDPHIKDMAMRAM